MPAPGDAKRVERQLMRDEVYEAIREWIIRGRLAPEEQVRDLELAEQLGISRTPVREALRRLEDEGLVETAAHRWTRIAPLQLSQGDEIYPMVWTLELLAVRLLAAPLGAEALAEMTAANERMAQALRDHDAAAATGADNEFHHVFVTASGNTELMAVLRELKAKLQRLEIFYFDSARVAGASIGEHQRIIRAFELDDREEAAAAVLANWRNFFERLRRSTARAVD